MANILCNGAVGHGAVRVSVLLPVNQSHMPEEQRAPVHSVIYCVQATPDALTKIHHQVTQMYGDRHVKRATCHKIMQQVKKYTNKKQWSYQSMLHIKDVNEHKMRGGTAFAKLKGS
jgi:hypothetical protein